MLFHHCLKKGTKRVRNKRIRSVLQSDIVLDLVNRGTRKLHGSL